MLVTQRSAARVERVDQVVVRRDDAAQVPLEVLEQAGSHMGVALPPLLLMRCHAPRCLPHVVFQRPRRTQFCCQNRVDVELRGYRLCCEGGCHVVGHLVYEPGPQHEPMRAHVLHVVLPGHDPSSSVWTSPTYSIWSLVRIVGMALRAIAMANMGALAFTAYNC